jgi:hypothetical protein
MPVEDGALRRLQIVIQAVEATLSALETADDPSHLDQIAALQRLRAHLLSEMESLLGLTDDT